MTWLRWLFVIAVLAPGGVAAAQQAGSSAEEVYLELRRSRDPATRLTAERYFNLVKLQEWTDATGRFSTQAKYVDHDPDFAWVKLEAVRGTGQDRTVGVIEVPFERLSRQSQSRVRQIARLKPRLDELTRAEADAAEERERAHAGGSPYNEGFRGDFEHEGRQPVETDHDGVAVGEAEWRTSYEAFRQNVSATTGPQGFGVDWGEMHELRVLSEALASPAAAAGGGHVKQRAVADAAARVGEVNWEAPFIGISNHFLLGPKVELQLPPPDGASIEFLLADTNDLMRWAQLPPGQTVRFHGRLGLRGPSALVVWVRMAEDSPGQVPGEAGRPQPPPEFDPGELGGREYGGREVVPPEFRGREAGGREFDRHE